MQNTPKVLVLADRGPASYYLINRLLASNAQVAVVFEKRPFSSRVTLLKRRAKRIGPVGIANQILLALFVRLVETKANSNNLRKIFCDQPTGYLTKDVEHLETEDINAAEVEAFIKSKAPDLVVVNGTSIIKAPIIRIFPRRIVNIHVGITPEYRGAHGGFWAMYNGQPELAGVTVHLIDPGIDSGEILFQEMVAVEYSDTLRTIAYRQQRKGIDLIFRCLDELESGSLQGHHRDSSRGKLYYSPGLTHYLKYLYAKRFHRVRQVEPDRRMRC